MNALLTGSHLLSEAADVIKWKNLGNVPVPVQNFNTLNEIVALKTLELYHFHLICMCVYINILNSLCVCVLFCPSYILPFPLLITAAYCMTVPNSGTSST